MLNKFARCLTAGVLIVGLGTAFAQTNPAGAATPAKLFQSLSATADMNIFTCSMAARTMLLGISMGRYDQNASAKVTSCTEKAKTEAQQEYAQLKTTLKDNKEAMAAVNDYAASLLSLLDDLQPRTGENSEQRYGYRIDAAQSELNKKANFAKLQIM